ncbi:MAG: hypothetical protein AB8B83_07715 [Bdellovibrionales bacterium]
MSTEPDIAQEAARIAAGDPPELPANATEEQREDHATALERYDRRVSELTGEYGQLSRNPGAGDMSPEELAARRNGEWSAELLNQLDPGSRYNIGNNISMIWKELVAVFVGFLGMTEKATDLRLENARFQRYAASEGDPISQRPMPDVTPGQNNQTQTRGLDGASEDLQTQFATNTHPPATGTPIIEPLVAPSTTRTG